MLDSTLCAPSTSLSQIKPPEGFFPLKSGWKRRTTGGIHRNRYHSLFSLFQNGGAGEAVAGLGSAACVHFKSTAGRVVQRGPVRPRGQQMHADPVVQVRDDHQERLHLLQGVLHMPR